MGLDAVVTLLGLVIPPGFDFIKKKFLKAKQDTPEATMSTLATTSPDTLPTYVTAITGYLEAQIKFFNRDVIGVPSAWIVDLRAAIRPITVVVGLFGLLWAGSKFWGVEIPVMDSGTRYFFEGVVASWFGSRLTREAEGS